MPKPGVSAKSQKNIVLRKGKITGVKTENHKEEINVDISCSRPDLSLFSNRRKIKMAENPRTQLSSPSLNPKASILSLKGGRQRPELHDFQNQKQ